MKKFILETLEKYPEKTFKIKFKNTYLYKFLKKNIYEDRE